MTNRFKRRLLLFIEATPDWTKTHLIEIEGADYEVPIYQLNVPEIVTNYMTFHHSWNIVTYNNHLTAGHITSYFVLPQYIELLMQMRDAEIDFLSEDKQEVSNKTLAALYRSACMDSVDPMTCLQFELDRIAASSYQDVQVPYITETLSNGWEIPPLMDIIERYFDTREDDDADYYEEGFLKTERCLLEENPREAIRDCWVFIGSNAQNFLENAIEDAKSESEAVEISKLTAADLVRRLEELNIDDTSLEPITVVDRIAERKPIIKELETRGLVRTWISQVIT